MEWMPELTKLLSTKSMMRYLPPKGTAGLARSRVSGKRRVPLPPARTMPRTRRRAGVVGKSDLGSGIEFTGKRVLPEQLSRRWYQRVRRRAQGHDEWRCG